MLRSSLRKRTNSASNPSPRHLWSLRSSTSGAGTLDLGAGDLAALTPGFSYALTDAASTVRAVLNALATDSKLNVVSSPSLMVQNNQEARIRVGQEVPIIVQQQQATVAIQSGQTMVLGGLIRDNQTDI